MRRYGRNRSENPPRARRAAARRKKSRQGLRGKDVVDVKMKRARAGSGVVVGVTHSMLVVFASPLVSSRVVSCRLVSSRVG